MAPPSRQQLEAQLLRARLSQDDFQEAAEYVLHLDAAVEDPVKRGLLTAAIIAYCRPFTQSDGGVSRTATSQLSVNLSKLFTDSERELHTRLLALRNEVLAHTAYDRKPVKRLQGTGSGFTMTGKLFDLLSEKIDISIFTTLCWALSAHCFTMMMELNRKIVEAENAS